MDLRKRFGKRIQELRKMRGLKQSELAELVDIANKTQSCIETGRNFPSVEVIERYTKALNIRLEDLMNISYTKSTDEKLSEIHFMLNRAKEHDIDIIYKFVKSVLC